MKALKSRLETPSYAQAESSLQNMSKLHDALVLPEA